MNIRLWINAVAVCAVLSLMPLAVTPTFAEAPKNCIEACEMVGKADDMQCIAGCDEIMAASPDESKVLHCIVEYLLNCPYSKTYIAKILIKEIEYCEKVNWRSDCTSTAACKAAVDCLKVMCRCLSSNPKKCVKAFKHRCE